MKRYTVVYEPAPRNWAAYVPDLDGVVATGRTRADVERLIREAIEIHIDGIREDGIPVPEPTSETGVIEVDR